MDTFVGCMPSANFLVPFLEHFPAQHCFSSSPISTSSEDLLVSVTDIRCQMYIVVLSITPQA